MTMVSFSDREQGCDHVEVYSERKQAERLGDRFGGGVEVENLRERDTGNDDHHVVNEGDQRRGREPHALEPEPNVDRNEGEAQRRGDDGLSTERLGDRRAEDHDAGVSAKSGLPRVASSRDCNVASEIAGEMSSSTIATPPIESPTFLDWGSVAPIFEPRSLVKMR